MTIPSVEIAYLDGIKLFWGKASGEISLETMGRAYTALLQHPSYSSEVDELVDFSETSVEHLTAQDFEQIRLYMTRRPDRHNTRSALVVGSELEFGLARMFGGMLGVAAPVDRGVFYTVEEALEWLHPGQSAELLAVHQAAPKTRVDVGG